MNETYAMKTYEQTFSITPEQAKAQAAAKQTGPAQPQAASAVSPALWVGLLAAFLWFRSK